MPENHLEGKEPLWILVEREIQKFTDEDFSEANSLETSRKIAAELDETGYNVSKSGGNWMRLRAAVKARNRVARPFMDDFNLAISALSLDDIEDTHATAVKIIRTLGDDWPAFLASENRADVNEIVSKKRVDLMVARAKELGGEQGIRYLIEGSFEPQAVMKALGVAEEEYNSVKSKVDAELAEKARVQELFTSLGGASEEDKIKRLINENASDELIAEIGGIAPSASSLPSRRARSSAFFIGPQSLPLRITASVRSSAAMA